MIQTATQFETMRVLHNLWSTNQITAVEVRSILKRQFNLELVVLANGSITAEDEKSKYKINQ
tara:strand:- start:5 stop:190 length:186 start_codon:yes stop_codon:yes gene_type:complete